MSQISHLNPQISIDKLKALGIKTTMLSGDKNTVVQFVAQKLGITNAFGDLLPEDKVNKVKEIIAKKVAEVAARGINIQHIHRIDRTGYKAGALDAAMDQVQGEFIAIFDADFVPDKDFLLRTIPYFNSDKIGVVQTRWGHLNKSYSLLTELQAFGLNGHFAIEQGGRNAQGHYINFNGTAGVWRKACIEDAGGWEHDTITEDLDLSYRAQMRGWKFTYFNRYFFIVIRSGYSSVSKITFIS